MSTKQEKKEKKPADSPPEWKTMDLCKVLAEQAGYAVESARTAHTHGCSSMRMLTCSGLSGPSCFWFSHLTKLL